MSLLAAIVLVVVFAYALAHVSMRLQRHITARSQWSTDQRRLSMAYSGLSEAAAAQDDMAYHLLQRVAQDELNSLRADSAAMSSKGVAQRIDFLDKAGGCLAPDVGNFAAQTPLVQDACRHLLAIR